MMQLVSVSKLTFLPLTSDLHNLLLSDKALA